MIIGFSLLILLVCFISVLFVLCKKNMHQWILSYILHKPAQRTDIDGPRHIIFCFVDHFEPQWGKNVTIDKERERVDRWLAEYPLLAKKHKDADGIAPQHTFFYPEEEYREEHLNKIQALCEAGFGEIEIHLHHDNDTEDNLRSTLKGFINTLATKHNSLSKDPDGNFGFAFIHGNWTLDNSHPDGKYCGINNEIKILKEEGCYVDMTLPSAPSPTQTRTINSIYMAIDDPKNPKSHDSGEKVMFNSPLQGDLMLVQGPLALNWKKRKWGFMPTIENGDIRRSFPPTKERVDLWVKQGIHIEGKPDWLFIKIHTHGTQDTDIDTLLGEPVDSMHSYLENTYNDGENYKLHYVTARELYNIVKAASDGKNGDPHEFRDYWFKKTTV